MMIVRRSLTLLCTFLCWRTSQSLSSSQTKPDMSGSPVGSAATVTAMNRKSFVASSLSSFGILSSGVALSLSLPSPARAKQAQQQKLSAQDEIAIIQEASETLETLLNNWEKATIDCTYADVPRELLESKNKEQLLEKASTFALFDKSTSVISCKKTNRIVRDYIGVTGKGPLVNVDKRMLKRYVADVVDPDDLDVYYSEVENFQYAMSRASAASYAAGVADFDSVNNFEKGEQKKNDNDDSNLEQARKAIGEALGHVQQIVDLLNKATT